MIIQRISAFRPNLGPIVKKRKLTHESIDDSDVQSNPVSIETLSDVKQESRDSLDPKKKLTINDNFVNIENSISDKKIEIENKIKKNEDNILTKGDIPTNDSKGVIEILDEKTVSKGNDIIKPIPINEIKGAIGSKNTFGFENKQEIKESGTVKEKEGVSFGFISNDGPDIKGTKESSKESVVNPVSIKENKPIESNKFGIGFGLDTKQESKGSETVKEKEGIVTENKISSLGNTNFGPGFNFGNKNSLSGFKDPAKDSKTSENKTEIAPPIQIPKTDNLPVNKQTTDYENKTSQKELSVESNKFGYGGFGLETKQEIKGSETVKEKEGVITENKISSLGNTNFGFIKPFGSLNNTEKKRNCTCIRDNPGKQGT